MIFQALHLDQVYRPLPTSQIGAVKNPAVSGTFGQPTLAVPFLALSLPLSVFFRRWWELAIIAVAIVLTGSDFALICLWFLLFLYSFRNKLLFCLTIPAAMAGVYMIFTHPAQYFNFNGRLSVWEQILKDVFTGQIQGVSAHIGMTGAGLNNFGTVFTALHSSPWTMAHN